MAAAFESLMAPVKAEPILDDTDDVKSLGVKPLRTVHMIHTVKPEPAVEPATVDVHMTAKREEIDWSPEEVGKLVAAFAVDYRKYEKNCTDHSFDGCLLKEMAEYQLYDDKNKSVTTAITLLTDIGIANGVHQRRIWSAARKLFGLKVPRCFARCGRCWGCVKDNAANIVSRRTLFIVVEVI